MHYLHPRLHDYAHARTGDKGNRLNVAVFVYDNDHYEWLLEELTEMRVLMLFRHRDARCVRRYPMPGLYGINLVIDDVLQGGVNGALNLDGHGKTLSYLVLSMSVRSPGTTEDDPARKGDLDSADSVEEPS